LDELAQWLFESWNKIAQNDDRSQHSGERRLPKKIDFTALKHKAGRQHAKQNVVTPEHNSNENFHFVETAIDSSNKEMQIDNNTGYDFSMPSVTKSKLVQLIVNSKKRRIDHGDASNNRQNSKSSLNEKTNEQAKTKFIDAEIQADGSVSSIYKWSKHAKQMDQ